MSCTDELSSKQVPPFIARSFAKHEKASKSLTANLSLHAVLSGIVKKLVSLTQHISPMKHASYVSYF